MVTSNDETMFDFYQPEDTLMITDEIEEVYESIDPQDVEGTPEAIEEFRASGLTADELYAAMVVECEALGD